MGASSTFGNINADVVERLVPGYVSPNVVDLIAASLWSDERVPREEANGFARDRGVGHEQRDPVRAMTARFEDIDAQRAGVDAVALMDRDVREGCPGAMADDDLRDGPLGELAMAADEIGMHVRLEDVSNLQAHFARFLQIGLQHRAADR